MSDTTCKNCGHAEEDHHSTYGAAPEVYCRPEWSEHRCLCPSWEPVPAPVGAAAPDIEKLEKLLDAVEDRFEDANGCRDCTHQSCERFRERTQEAIAARLAITRAFSLLKEERDALAEWKKSVLSALQHQSYFIEGEWAGDKSGWGFVFEYVNWMYREVSRLRSEVERLEASALTEKELTELLVLARHEARMQRDTPEWDWWLNLADKITELRPASPTTGETDNG